MRLSEELDKWRIDRPDEWKMDEFARKARQLEDAIESMADDGWLYHGVEGMSDAQIKCHAAYLTINPPNA